MRIRKALAKTCSAALAAAMLMAGVPEAAGIQTPFAVTAQAAKKKTVKKKKKAGKVKKKYKENPKLSKTRLSIRNKKTATVKVSGTKKGISVTSSDKSIATVSRSGKYAFRIKAAKKKKGVAVIRVKTSRGYRYVFVQVGGRTNMSGKTRTWAQAGGFIQAPQPSTPQAQQPQTVPSVPSQPSVPQPQQPSVTQPQAQPETRQPEAQPQTTPETKAPETQPETKTPETQPQTTPETKAPETQPETKTPETQPETKQSETQKQTESEAVPVTRASLYDSSLEARKAYDLKVATQCGFFDNSVSYKQKLQNMMHWMENNVNYDLNNVGCWQAFYQYADNTTYFSDLHKNWPDEYPEGVLCYDGAGYILNFACYFLNLKGTLFRADTPGIGWSGHIAAAIYLPAQGADPAGWYVVNPSYKNYGMRKMKVERITEQSNKTWYDDIIRSVTDYEPRTKQSIIRDDLMNYRP